MSVHVFQAQEVNTAILKAADTCQKVAMRQALLAQSTISSTLRQFRETENQMKVRQSHVSRMGRRGEVIILTLTHVTRSLIG